MGAAFIQRYEIGAVEALDAWERIVANNSQFDAMFAWNASPGMFSWDRAYEHVESDMVDLPTGEARLLKIEDKYGQHVGWLAYGWVNG